MPTPGMIKDDLHTPPKSLPTPVVPKDCIAPPETNNDTAHPEDEVNPLKVALYSVSIQDETEPPEAKRKSIASVPHSGSIKNDTEIFTPKKFIAPIMTTEDFPPPVTTDLMKMKSMSPPLLTHNNPKDPPIKESNDTNDSSTLKRQMKQVHVPIDPKQEILSYDWQKHSSTVHTPLRNLNPTYDDINKLQRSVHRKTLTILFITSTITKFHDENLDKDAFRYFQGTICYKPKAILYPMSEQFIQYLQFILDFPVFPQPLRNYQELGQIHLPFRLVNTFEGNLQNLAMCLCELSPSFSP